MADLPLPPDHSVRSAGEKFLRAMDDVRKANRAIESATRELEIYAREQAGDFEHTANARIAYRDMADRIKALLG